MTSRSDACRICGESADILIGQDYGPVCSKEHRAELIRRCNEMAAEGDRRRKDQAWQDARAMEAEDMNPYRLVSEDRKK